MNFDPYSLPPLADCERAVETAQGYWEWALAEAETAQNEWARAMDARAELPGSLTQREAEHARLAADRTHAEMERAYGDLLRWGEIRAEAAGPRPRRATGGGHGDRCSAQPGDFPFPAFVPSRSDWNLFTEGWMSKPPSLIFFDSPLDLFGD